MVPQGLSCTFGCGELGHSYIITLLVPTMHPILRAEQRIKHVFGTFILWSRDKPENRTKWDDKNLGNKTLVTNRSREDGTRIDVGEGDIWFARGQFLFQKVSGRRRKEQ